VIGGNRTKGVRTERKMNGKWRAVPDDDEHYEIVITL
jgi:hypothetical protein